MKQNSEKTRVRFLQALAIGACYVWLIVRPEDASLAAAGALSLCAKVIVPSLFPFFVCANLFCALHLRSRSSGRCPASCSRCSACRVPARRRLSSGLRADTLPARRPSPRCMQPEASTKKRRKASSVLQQLRSGVHLRRRGTGSVRKQACRAAFIHRPLHVRAAAGNSPAQKNSRSSLRKCKRRAGSSTLLFSRPHRQRQKSRSDGARGVHVRAALRRADCAGAKRAESVSSAVSADGAQRHSGAFRGAGALAELALAQGVKFTLASMLLAFGGLSVHAQTRAVLTPTGLGSLPVFLPKLLHALTAGLLSIPVYRLFDAQLASSAAFAACGAGAGFALMELTLSVLACLIFRKMAASNLHRDRV